MRIAIPSMQPGGLDARRSDHFGHCELFTLVDLEDGRISQVDVVSNSPHSGDCQAPVDLLDSQKVNGLLVSGIGMRPLVGFRQAGIDVYFAPEGRMVGDAVELFLKGSLKPITGEQVCGGGGHGGGGRGGGFGGGGRGGQCGKRGMF